MSGLRLIGSIYEGLGFICKGLGLQGVSTHGLWLRESRSYLRVHRHDSMVV